MAGGPTCTLLGLPPSPDPGWIWGTGSACTDCCSLACWQSTPDRSRTSTSKAVQVVWEVYLDILRLVPLEVRDDLHKFCHIEPDPDRAWEAWCRAAEVGLLSAHKAAGGPCPQGDQPFLGGGTAVIRTRLVGGRAPGRLHRSARADEVDTANCHVFVNASLAPVILFRRRRHSVGAVLQGIRKSGLSIARWQALMLRWAAVCRQGPTGPMKTVDPCRDWHLPDLHGFNKWVFDSIDEL